MNPTKDKYGNIVTDMGGGFNTATAPTPTLPNAQATATLSTPASTPFQTEGVSKADIPALPTTDIFKADASALVKQNRELQQSVLQAQAPTAQEQALTEQMTKLNTEARQAIATAEQSGETQRFAAGETARVSRQASIQIQALADQLNALTNQRSVRLDALKTQMQFNKENLETISNLSKLTQPDVLSTGVDKKTGEIYSLVKDPQTGEVKQNIVGRVTPEEAKLDYLKSYTDANGNEVASFLDPSTNTIVNRVLGKATGDLLSPTEATTLGVPYGTTKTQAAELAKQGTGAAPKALEQINLVKGSLDRAKALAGASGRSGVRKTVESWLVGSTDYTNLVAETNTLRTNVLTMMTDPAIKKFFGPQMSNADVQLMTSAGTTLNPELQNADNMRKELGRLEDLVKRAEKAVTQGSQGPTKEQEALRTKYNY